ncbi:MAG: glycoside hydrolase family 127 protein [Nitrososphaerota archaeon]
MATNVVDTSKSSYAVLRPVPLESVEIRGGFWGRWVNQVVESAIKHQYKMLEESDRVNRFRYVAGKISEKPLRSLYVFDDSDLYKWLEACGYYFARKKDEELRRVVEGVIDDVVSAQEEDGYLFTEYHGSPERRWKNLTFDHELYCAGHFIQGAIALHRSLGGHKIFGAARRFADLIAKTFNPEGIRGVCGHPEIEMALVELYRETGEERYLETAEFFINERGREALRPAPDDKLNSALYRVLGGPEYFVDHRPVRELEEITGHAVRALYLNCGATDLYLEKGDKTLWDAMSRLWENFVRKKMYVTGAAGSRYVSEAFGEDYELPNERAYAETCAAIVSFMWNWRMLLATGEARFADIMESTLYNSILSGVSLDGARYFYMNPLASGGGYSRSPWFPCACCPPNIARLLASLPAYFYSTSGRGLWIHLYGSSKASVSLNGVSVGLSQETDYPWSGEARILVEAEEPATFSLFLRIPGWCVNPLVKLDDRAFSPRPSTYLEIRRRWRGRTVIKTSFPLRVEMLTSHPYVRNNISQVALRRGPLVYCVESPDNRVDPRNIVLGRRPVFRVKYDEDLLHGVATISFAASEVNMAQFSNNLYKVLDGSMVKKRKVRVTAIPYYAWANRGDSVMITWIPFADYWRGGAAVRL